MDGLSTSLNSSNVEGGHIGGNLLHHLCYADDICLISNVVMQCLLNICIMLSSIHYYIMGINHSQCALNPKKLNLKVLFCF